MIEYSIIIPIYNAEKTLRKCLDSILAQSVMNYEVLLIDDGSKDSSFRICQEYQKKDKRFMVYHQQNRGPSVARNHGLKLAKGKWICFIDSDDAVTSDYLQYLSEIATMENAEVIFMGYSQFDDFGNEIQVYLPNSEKSDKFGMILDLSKQDMFGYTWIKTFKKSIIDTICFKEELNLFEDEVFTCEVLANCERISILKKPIYNYVKGTSSSLTSKLHCDYCKKCQQVFEAWKYLLKLYEDKEQVLDEKANQFVLRCRYYGFEHKINVKSFFTDLSETEYFKVNSSCSRFGKYVQGHVFWAIWIEKKLYQLKQRLYRLKNVDKR